jgi:Tfp pilus assembly protein PilN
VEKYLKYIPLALLAIYGIKMLFSVLSWFDVACLGILGITAFLYEHNIQQKAIALLAQEKAALAADLEIVKADLSHIKAFVTSAKMNNMRLGNGQNK